MREERRLLASLCCLRAQGGRARGSSSTATPSLEAIHGPLLKAMQDAIRVKHYSKARLRLFLQNRRDALRRVRIDPISSQILSNAGVMHESA